MGRPDGVRVEHEDLMYTLVPNFMCTRTDSMNAITEYIPVEPLKNYINEKRAEGKRISHLALIMCAYTMASVKFPYINRFIVNKKIYQRNEWCASMVVLRPGHGGDTFSKIKFDPENDTIFDVQQRLDDYVAANKTAEEDNSLDWIMNVIQKMGFLVGAACSLIRWMDKHNILPRKIIEISPFHTSFLISNLASIRTNHIYHHVYEFGTTSVSITMGNMVDMPKRTKDGIELERCIPLGVVMDERICSGHYFAQMFNFVHDLLMDPHKMETPMSAR